MNKCMWFLLPHTNTRGIWLDIRIKIDTDNIKAIIGLSWDGPDVTKAFMDKFFNADKDAPPNPHDQTDACMKYVVEKFVRGFNVTIINSFSISMSTQLLSI